MATKHFQLPRDTFPESVSLLCDCPQDTALLEQILYHFDKLALRPPKSPPLIEGRAVSF